MLILLSAVSFFVGFDNVDILSLEVGIVNYYILFNCFFRLILLFTQVFLSTFFKPGWKPLTISGWLLQFMLLFKSQLMVAVCFCCCWGLLCALHYVELSLVKNLFGPLAGPIRLVPP